MTQSYGTDLRMRVIKAIEQGLSTRKAAARYEVSVAAAGEWYRRYRDHGETEPRKQGQPPGSKLDAYESFILALVEAKPDIALHEIAERLGAERCVSVCPATVWHFFDKRAITYKKRLHMRPSRSAAM